MGMDGKKLVNHQRKYLTDSDKSDKIWYKFKAKAQYIGCAKLKAEIIIYDGVVTTIHYWPKETIIAEDN